jgi:Na+-transporting methylmalonyl-CoA/oxaloacetate decarboxylase gamma subunit
MNNMLIALQITALGMGLVFGAIILLWWMMNLLTFLTAEKEASPSTGASHSVDTVPVMDNDMQAQAAAVAVAIALAELPQSTAHLFQEPPTTIVSAWQLGMRTRQMYQKGSQTPRKQDNQ